MEKEIRFIVSFCNTSEATAFEDLCKTKGVEGRMIPIPEELKAGCGMVWSAPLRARTTLMPLLDDPDTFYCERTLLAL